MWSSAMVVDGGGDVSARAWSSWCARPLNELLRSTEQAQARMKKNHLLTSAIGQAMQGKNEYKKLRFYILMFLTSTGTTTPR
jgi:hypothetical protein